MGARQKLNAGYFTGSLLVAALIGVETESWLVFTIALLILVGLNLYCREIRPPRNGHQSRHGRDRH